MFRKFLLGIVASSAVVLLSTEAGAATCLQYRSIGGSKTCVKWSPGSEKCEVKISGLDNDLGEGQAGNVTVECSAEGTGANGSMTGSLFCAIPGSTVDPAEGCKHVFQGAGTGHTTNAGNPGHPGDCNVFPNTNTEFSVILSDTEPLAKCNGKGVCETSIELNLSPEAGAELCQTAGGGTFVTFTANSFCAFVEVCGLPNGEGTICQQIEELCTLSGGSYNCVPLPEGQSCAGDLEYPS